MREMVALGNVGRSEDASQGDCTVRLESSLKFGGEERERWVDSGGMSPGAVSSPSRGVTGSSSQFDLNSSPTLLVPKI